MTIIEALQTENIKLTNGNRWLIGDEGCWTVFEDTRQQLLPVRLITTDDEAEAVRVLLEG